MKVLVVTLLVACCFTGFAYGESFEHERNPFAMTSALLSMLTRPVEGDRSLMNDLTNVMPTKALFENGLPHIELKAVSFVKERRTALLKTADGKTMLVREKERLYLIEKGEFIEMNVLEIRPRSVRIELLPDEQIIEIR